MEIKYIDKINEMIKLLEAKHIDAYFNISKEDLQLYIEKLLTEYKLEDDYDFYYVANMILKKVSGIYDSHTSLEYKDYKTALPIKLKCFDDKLYVIKATEENENIKYGQVLKINGVDINTLISEVEKIVAYSTKGFLEFKIEMLFRNENQIKSLPSIDNNCEEFIYTILKDGNIQDIKLKKGEAKFGGNINYTYNILDDVIVINYTNCAEKYKGQMLEFVDTIKKESLKNNINKYVVNIRENLGGNSEIINPLIEFLKGKEIITIADKYVFSAARWALCVLIEIGSKTVGTGIATSMNCFGNTPGTDFGNFNLKISEKYFHPYDKSFDDKNEFMSKKEELKANGYFNPIIYEPDYYVENTLEDYINNRDRQLECAIKILNDKTNDLEEEKKL